MQGAKAFETHQDALEDLRNDHADLWHKLLVFIRDLFHSQDADAEERLAAAQTDCNQYFFFSAQYFDDGLNRILDLPGPSGENLRTLLSNWFSNAPDGEVCAGHTLYPRLCDFFRLKPDFWDNKGFVEMYAEFQKTWKLKQKKTKKAAKSAKRQ